MATAPVYYSDQLVKEFIDKEFAGKTGDALYQAVANEAVNRGVSAEQLGRVLGLILLLSTNTLPTLVNHLLQKQRF